MGIPFRKVLTDAITSCLATGFNQALAANAGVYNVDPFQIDFAPGNGTFAQCYVDPDQIEDSPLLEFPAACVFTDDAEEFGTVNSLQYAGAVIGCVGFFIRQRQGIEGGDTESALNRIDDAVLTLFRAYTWPIVQNISTVTYSRRAKSTRRHFVPLGDGWASHIDIRAQFSVFIN